MANAFDVNQSVATAYVGAEQLKGWFLANAKKLLVILSGAQLCCGVVALSWHGSLTFTLKDVPLVLSILPMALIGLLLAVCIEGGTIFSSAMRVEVTAKMRQEIALLDKVKTKLGSEEYELRKAIVERQKHVPTGLMIVCILFSVTGAEIFWQRLFDGQPWYYHIFGFILGITCSSLLIIFELNGDLVERVIEKCITSSGLIQIALDQSAKSQIHEVLFQERSRKLKTPEFRAIITRAAEQGLLGVVTDAVNMAGANVTSEQLMRSVEEEREVTQAAEAYLASGGKEEPKQLPPPKDIGRRVTANRRKVEVAMKKFGSKRMRADLDKHSAELGMDRRTLERWMNDIDGISA